MKGERDIERERGRRHPHYILELEGIQQERYRVRKYVPVRERAVRVSGMTGGSTSSPSVISP